MVDETRLETRQVRPISRHSPVADQFGTAYVRTILAASGYGAKNTDTGEWLFSTARFAGMTTAGKEHWHVFFDNDDDGLPDVGDVYVWQEDGMLKADF